MLRRRLLTPFVLLVALMALPASVAHAGEQTLKFRFGPIIVTPGQNDIIFEPNKHKPKVPGWITSFKPNLVYKDGTPTRTDVIHLHHGVWLKNVQPQFAAGEEKSDPRHAAGYGWRSEPVGLIGAEPHGPQPDPERGRGLPHVGGRLHRRGRSRRRGHPHRRDEMARRRRDPCVAGLRRRPRAGGPRQAVHVPRRGPGLQGRELPLQPLDRQPRRRAGRQRRATCIPAGSTPS